MAVMRPGEMRGRVLLVAGSDSSGGAGVQADVKTVTALGAYAATAVTAVTAQDTRGVRGVLPVPPDFLQLQLSCVLDDIGADVIKTGMLGGRATVEALCGVLEARISRPQIVIDPVTIATGGQRLLDADAVTTVKRRLLPLAALLTPNLSEAELLTGMTIRDMPAMHAAASMLLTLGVPAVLLKGGHMSGPNVTDLLATTDGVEAFSAPRLPGNNTHGTGCTLGSAVAAGLAQGMPVRDAVLRARAYVRAAIDAAPGLGGGHGPLNHAVTVDLSRLVW